MALFGGAPSFTQQPSSALAQILAMIPKDGARGGGDVAQNSGIPQIAGAPAGGGNLDMPGLLQQFGDLQSLPWLSDSQNMASQASALGQASGTPGGSALSMLASLFK